MDTGATREEVKMVDEIEETNEETVEETTEEQSNDTEQSNEDETPKGDESSDKGEGDKEEGPVEIDFEAMELPEGTELTDVDKELLGELINFDGTPEERASKLIAISQDMQQKQADATMEQWMNTRQEWVNEAKADKEFGGEAFDANLLEIDKVVEKYGSAELREVFDATGAGDNPHVIRFLHKIAQDIGEGLPAGGDTVENTEADRASLMFPSANKD
jgi:hypothetical protein